MRSSLSIAFSFGNIARVRAFLFSSIYAVQDILYVSLTRPLLLDVVRVQVLAPKSKQATFYLRNAMPSFFVQSGRGCLSL